MLESVERPGQQTHMARKRCVEKTGGLLTINLLLKMAVEEGVGDIHLMNGPSVGHSELEDGADRARFNNRGKCVGEVHARALSKAPNHPASFIALESTVRTSLVPKDPLARDDVGTGRPRDELPGTVPLERVEFFLHRSEPMRILKGGSS